MKIRHKNQYFGSREASALAGFRTVHMLDYLCRSGIVVPSKAPSRGRGRKRFYTFGDLVLLRSINKLLAKGLPVKKLAEALGVLQKRFREISADHASPKYLFTDGVRVIWQDDTSGLVDLTAGGQFAFSFVIDIEIVKTEVKSELSKKAS